MKKTLTLLLTLSIFALGAAAQSSIEGFTAATTISESDLVWAVDVSEPLPNDRKATFEQIVSPFAADPSSNSAFDPAEWAADLNITSEWGDVTGTPTTLSGYGITDAYTQAEVLALIPWLGNYGGNIAPSNDVTYTLGLSGKRWAEIYANGLHATDIELSGGGVGVTDTTLSRSAAGVLAVEGVDVLTTATGYTQGEADAAFDATGSAAMVQAELDSLATPKIYNYDNSSKWLVQKLNAIKDNDYRSSSNTAGIDHNAYDESFNVSGRLNVATLGDSWGDWFMTYFMSAVLPLYTDQPFFNGQNSGLIIPSDQYFVTDGTVYHKDNTSAYDKLWTGSAVELASGESFKIVGREQYQVAEDANDGTWTLRAGDTLKIAYFGEAGGGVFKVQSTSADWDASFADVVGYTSIDTSLTAGVHVVEVTVPEGEYLVQAVGVSGTVTILGGEVSYAERGIYWYAMDVGSLSPGSVVSSGQSNFEQAIDIIGPHFLSVGYADSVAGDYDDFTPYLTAALAGKHCSVLFFDGYGYYDGDGSGSKDVVQAACLANGWAFCSLPDIGQESPDVVPSELWINASHYHSVIGKIACSAWIAETGVLDLIHTYEGNARTLYAKRKVLNRLPAWSREFVDVNDEPILKLSQQTTSTNEFGFSPRGTRKNYFRNLSEAIPARAYTGHASVGLNEKLTVASAPASASGSFSVRFAGKVDFDTISNIGLVFSWEAGSVGPVGNTEKGISLVVLGSQSGTTLSANGMGLMLGDGAIFSVEWGTNELLSEFHDWVVVYDATAAEVRMFIDGQLWNVKSTGVAIDWWDAGHTQATFFNDASRVRDFAGDAAFVAFYDAALTDAQVLDTFYNPVSASAYAACAYSFGVDDGTTAKDLSANGNDALWNTAPAFKSINPRKLELKNAAAATTLGTVTDKMEVFDRDGVSMGFVPVYDSIN